MAKIKVCGDAAVIESSVTLEQYKTVAKYRPNELTLKGGEDGKTVLVKVGVAEKGGINKYGVTFDGATRDENGYATVTVIIPKGTDDPKQWIIDEFGSTLLNLEAIEAKLTAVLEDVAEDAAAISSMIEIA